MEMAGNELRVTSNVVVGESHSSLSVSTRANLVSCVPPRVGDPYTAVTMAPRVNEAARKNLKNVREAREEEYKRQRAEQAKIVKEWFDAHDTNDDGQLQREELRQLLKLVAKAEPGEDALDMALEFSKKGGGTEDAVPKRMAFDVVSKVAAYVKEQAVVEPMFKAHDIDSSGGIDAKELMPILRKIAVHSGIDADAVTEEDVAHVIELSDKDKSGTIERNELMLASATWKRLLTDGKAPHMKAQAKSSTCNLL